MGHSLGAGAAALLALMLKSPYPQVRCYAFSPPRGLLRYSFPFTYAAKEYQLQRASLISFFLYIFHVLYNRGNISGLM